MFESCLRYFVKSSKASHLRLAFLLRRERKFSATLVWGLFRRVGSVALIRSGAFFICVALIDCPRKGISYNGRWRIFNLKGSN